MRVEMMREQIKRTETEIKEIKVDGKKNKKNPEDESNFFPGRQTITQ
jgi:hypothetical protein